MRDRGRTRNRNPSPPSPPLERGLEALPVNDSWSTLVVFLLGHPEVLEGTQTGEDTSSDPDGIFPLGGCDDLDFHARGTQAVENALAPGVIH
jgi:hypothetical protein